MKKSILFICLAATLSMSCAAQTIERSKINNGELKPKSTLKVEKPEMNTADYGVYRIMSDLTVSPVNLTDPEQIIAVSGNEALVRKTSSSSDDKQKLRPNTVVKNTLSGELGVVSGNLLLVVKDASALSALQAEHNLTVVSQTAGTNLVLMKAADNTDLQLLLEQLKASGLVKSVKLDIAEKRYINR